jgi:hypothetical protein
MLRNPERDYENVAAAGPVVHQEDDGSFRMWYSAIGTRWGAYSIAYAESDDGLCWRRGQHYGDNLQLGPIGTGWERQMVEYPAVIREDNRLRLFYCGNGYGLTGIGMALSSSLRATATARTGEVEIVAAESKTRWRYRIPDLLACAEGATAGAQPNGGRWHGPDAKGMIWYEQHPLRLAESGVPAAASPLDKLQYRVMLTPVQDGLEIRVTVKNQSKQTIHSLALSSASCQTSPAEMPPILLQETWVQEDMPPTGAKTSKEHDGQQFIVNAPVSLGDLAPGATLTRCGKVRAAATADNA